MRLIYNLMSIIELESAILNFAIGITLFAVATIFLIYIAINHKGIIQMYLRLKSSDTQVDKIIDEIFKRDKLFDELIKIWVSYKNAKIFLLTQLVVLLGSIPFTVMFMMSQSAPKNLDLNLLIYLFILLVYLFVYIWIFKEYLINPIILNTFKLSEKEFKKTKFILPFTLIWVFITSAPPLSVLFYIITNNLPNNISTAVAVYFILTTGIYETTKLALGFVLPTPPVGIYSTKELIQKISLALRGEANALKEIIDKANDC